MGKSTAGGGFRLGGDYSVEGGFNLGIRQPHPDLSNTTWMTNYPFNLVALRDLYSLFEQRPVQDK